MENHSTWKEITDSPEYGGYRRWRYRVTEEFSADVWISRLTSDEFPFHLIFSTRVERDNSHISDHPIAAYQDLNQIQSAVRDLQQIIIEIVSSQDIIISSEYRLAYDVIPKFANQMNSDNVYRTLYDPDIVDND